ncbi:phage tail sheath family protein [Sinanaerobacter sp. ZZT-01]|uniref:phage tail sheath family protein n=1 Tax=Sinanaerobacter sp. ZZT-01 TaxID=3111540 RepID=UPI002D778A65|nr:phage tail sheath family protein [Sinanaerobacter sp. ZZT-01]WRR94092.1 phage tail sheath family protein [Sinanaerobacter sp. ZZT-01]
MALGGGVFTAQNKFYPGSYINFVSAQKASAILSDRGYAAMPLELDWGKDGDVFSVSAEKFQKDSLKILGYDYTADQLKGLRDLFQNGLRVAYLYRLNSGNKAENDFAQATCSGIRGNSIKIVIEKNVDDSERFDISTLFDAKLVDKQTVKTVGELTDNDYVIWKKEAALTENAGVSLSGGTNKEAVAGADYADFLSKAESYSFNVLGCLSTDEAVCNLFTAFTKRMREEYGAKFQTVLYRTAADHEGVISVENTMTDSAYPQSALVYWTVGAQATRSIGGGKATLSNQVYNGEFEVKADYTQTQLADGLKSGKFLFHKVGDEIRVLEDINTLTSFTNEKSEDFSANQSIRVLDQIANDIADVFNSKYLGNIPNDDSGRVMLWNDIVRHHQELQKLQAIENFTADDVKVMAGDTKKSVVVEDHVTLVNAMSELYMTVVVQ